MKVRFFIPYAASDPKNGFRCDRDFTPTEYAKMEITEYKDHKQGVDDMMPYVGENISINNYEKRRINVKPQSYYYYECDGNIVDVDNKEVTTHYLDEMYRTQEKFILMTYLDAQAVSKDDDLETEIKQWVSDSIKVWTCDALDDAEKLTHLPKKDFKIRIYADKTNAVLKDCRMLERKGSNTAFAILVDKIIFVKN